MDNQLFLNLGIFGDFPVEAKLEAAKAAGFDMVEVLREDCEAISGGARTIARICGELGLVIASVMVLRDVVGIPREMVAAKRRDAIEMFELALELGTDCVQSPSTSLTNADHASADDDLDWLAREAAQRSLRIAYEALSWASVDRRLLDVSDRVGRLKAANVGIELDLFHHCVRSDPLVELDEIPINAIFQVQLSDLPASVDVTSDESLIFAARHLRVLPGDGHFDLRLALSGLHERGYRGPIGVEVFSDVMKRMDPRIVAMNAMTNLRRLLPNPGPLTMSEEMVP